MSLFIVNFSVKNVVKVFQTMQGEEGIFGEMFLVENLEHNSGSRFMVRSGLPLAAPLSLA